MGHNLIVSDNKASSVTLLSQPERKVLLFVKFQQGTIKSIVGSTETDEKIHMGLFGSDA